jgi:hypothetical protein
LHSPPQVLQLTIHLGAPSRQLLQVWSPSGKFRLFGRTQLQGCCLLTLFLASSTLSCSCPFLLMLLLLLLLLL